jgi:hypothetical protein
MFHAMAVNTAKIDAHSRPRTEWGKRAMKAVTVTERNPRTGTDWRMSRIGSSTAAARRERAAAVA